MWIKLLICSGKVQCSDLTTDQIPRGPEKGTILSSLTLDLSRDSTARYDNCGENNRPCSAMNPAQTHVCSLLPCCGLIVSDRSDVAVATQKAREKE